MHTMKQLCYILQEQCVSCQLTCSFQCKMQDNQVEDPCIHDDNVSILLLIVLQFTCDKNSCLKQLSTSPKHTGNLLSTVVLFLRYGKLQDNCDVKGL